MGDEAKDPRIDTVLQGRYRILERIATGAMGAIYRAARVKLGRQVAIKFLDVSFSAEKEELVQRFEREAHAMSRLGHPHCVSVIDFGVGDRPYIVMEYVTGTSLEELVLRGRLPPERAIRIIRQVLAGLAHAHGQGIIHRDMKPGNIMLTEATGTGDHARILDFGLAKLLDCAARDISTAKVVLGTPSYMSPEQSRGKLVDARTDVYSVGVVLFELLSGKKPFEGENKLETLRLHQLEPAPRLSDVTPNTEFSDELEAVMSKALAKEPDDRFNTAIEFAEALEAVPEASPEEHAEPENKVVEVVDVERTAAAIIRTPRRTSGLLIFLFVLVAGSAGAWYGWQKWGPGAKKRSAHHPRATPAHAKAGGKGPKSTHASALAPGDAPSTVPADAAPTDAAPVDAIPADAGATDAAPTDALDDDAGLEDEELTDPGPIVVFTPEDDDWGLEVTATPEPTKPPPPPIRSIRDAKAAIAEGRREDAIRGLRSLARKRPKSAYIPYLLGQLYYEKLWVTPAMESYATAIQNDRSYRKKRTIIKHAIHTLGSRIAAKKAVSLILHSIGPTALPYLQKAAKNDRNRTVRQRAAWIIKRMSSGKKKKKKR